MKSISHYMKTLVIKSMYMLFELNIWFIVIIALAKNIILVNIIPLEDKKTESALFNVQQQHKIQFLIIMLPFFSSCPAFELSILEGIGKK